MTITTDKNIIKKGETVPGEISAAIAAALYRIAESTCDTEKNKLTINRIPGTHSSWNSKIYGLREPLKR
jgi:hypothetical protein